MRKKDKKITKVDRGKLLRDAMERDQVAINQNIKDISQKSCEWANASQNDAYLKQLQKINKAHNLNGNRNFPKIINLNNDGEIKDGEDE